MKNSLSLGPVFRDRNTMISLAGLLFLVCTVFFFEPLWPTTEKEVKSEPVLSWSSPAFPPIGRLEAHMGMERLAGELCQPDKTWTIERTWYSSTTYQLGENSRPGYFLNICIVSDFTMILELAIPLIPYEPDVYSDLYGNLAVGSRLRFYPREISAGLRTVSIADYVAPRLVGETKL